MASYQEVHAKNQSSAANVRQVWRNPVNFSSTLTSSSGSGGSPVVTIKDGRPVVVGIVWGSRPNYGGFIDLQQTYSLSASAIKPWLQENGFLDEQPIWVVSEPQ